MYCGCVLIKPDTSFVQTYPDIFINNKTYIPCKVDFSDLQEKVDFVKNNWDLLYDLRASNMRMLLKATNLEIFSRHFSRVINKFFKKGFNFSLVKNHIL